MSPRRFTGLGRRGWRGAALGAAAVMSVALAGSGQARAGTPGAGAPAAGTISTVTGGIGGPGKATSVAISPCGVSFINGHLYLGETDGPANETGFASFGVLRQMSPRSGRLSNPVGTEPSGGIANGIPATQADIGPCAAAGDPSGNLVVTDLSNDLVRVVAHSTGTFFGQPMTAGNIYTIAGNGNLGFSGDGGPGTRASVYAPNGVAVDAAGNAVIADTFNGRVRVVAATTGTFYGQAMTAGNIYTIASGQLQEPVGVAVDAAGNVVIGDGSTDRVWVLAATAGTFYGLQMTAGNMYFVAGDGNLGFSGDGGPATNAGMSVSGITLDAAGNLLIGDWHNQRIRVVARKAGTFYGRRMKAGFVYSAASNIPAAKVAVDPSGNLAVVGFSADVARVVAERTGTFYGVAMTAGKTYIIAGTGHPYGYSGDGGPATIAELGPYTTSPFGPSQVAADSAGNVVIADTPNNRVRVVAAVTGSFYGVAMKAGNIYTVAGNGLAGDTGDLGPAISAAIGAPEGVALDAAGNLLIVSTNSTVRVVAAATGTFYRQAMKRGDIYTIAGNGTGGFSGDGGPATKAKLDNPLGAAVDSAGNVVIADQGSDRVRVVAAKAGTFYGLAMKAGNIYTVAGNGLSTGGDGGPARQAGLVPEAVAVDAAGNLVIADLTGRIRVVAAKTGSFYGQAMTADDIYTVAGGGTSGLGDGGPATGAELTDPSGVAVDAAGNLVIADVGDERIRVVAEGTGTFYGVAMTTGNIYTVAGNGTPGFGGNGGPATSAELNGPFGAAVDAAGNLLIADALNGRIREVTG